MPEANGVLFEAIYQKNGAGQLQCIAQVEESMGGGVSREEALVNDPAAELIERSSRWTPALSYSSRRSFGDIQDLAAVG